MKKIVIMIITLIVSVLSAKGQDDRICSWDTTKVPYYLFRNTYENTPEWHEYWDDRMGDSLAPVAFRGDTINGLIAHYPIDEYSGIDYVFFDSYISNGKNYLIFRKEAYTLRGDESIKWVTEMYYTTEPNTKIFMYDFKTNTAYARRYCIFHTTEEEYKLTKKEIAFLKSKDLSYYYSFE